MGMYKPLDKIERGKIDPVILRQLESVTNKLMDARDMMIDEGHPTDKAESLIRQAKLTLKSVERLCHFN